LFLDRCSSEMSLLPRSIDQHAVPDPIDGLLLHSIVDPVAGGLAQ
jgi:hypothetical protein